MHCNISETFKDTFCMCFCLKSIKTRQGKVCKTLNLNFGSGLVDTASGRLEGRVLQLNVHQNW